MQGRNQGLEILKGDILIDKGLIKDIGKISHAQLEQYSKLEVYDAHGAFVSPG
jgi:cytosine/adenosine deaminase-related metal-dependent hydrolase